MFQVLSHLCLSTSKQVHVGIIPGVQLGHRQALRDRDSSRTENRWETGGESGPRSVNSELHTQPNRELCGRLCGATV